MPLRLKRYGPVEAFGLVYDNADAKAALAEAVDAFGERSFKKVSPKRMEAYDRIVARFRLAGEQHPKPDTWPTLEKGTAAPDKTHLKFFILWLLHSGEGLIGPPITVNEKLRAPMISIRTLKSYLATIIEALNRLGFVVSREDYADARRYAASDELLATGKPTTAMFPKYIATREDLLYLLIEIWVSLGIRSTRMRMQLAFGILLAAISSERPGAIWESSSHAGSNQALLYRDCEVFIMQDPEDLDGPGIPVVRITLNLLKGMRFEDSCFKTIFIYPEPDQERLFCPVHLLMALALDDGAFADVQTIEEALDLSKCSTTHLRRLAWSPEWESRPIMRDEVFSQERGWQVCEQRALTCNAVRHHMHTLSQEAGLEHSITPYSLRRNAANIFAHEIDDRERELLMGHTIESRQFRVNYQSRTSHVDIGALHAGRAQSALRAALTGKVESMSRVVLRNAPRVLTAKQRLEIAQDPELKECDAARQEALEEADECQKELSRLAQSSDNDDDDAQAADNAVSRREELTAKRKAALAVANKHRKRRQGLFRAELAATVKEARQEAFDDVTNGRRAPSELEASGLQSTISIPDAFRGGSGQLWKGKPPPQALSDVLELSYDNRWEEYFAIITSEGDFRSHQFVEVIESLLVPDDNAPKLYYDGEEPGPSDICPFAPCEIALKSLPHRGKHVHQCARRVKKAALQAQLDDEYVPCECPMLNCRKTRDGVVFETRTDFVQHISTHFTTKACRWQVEGSICGCLAPEWTVADWACHVAEEHGMNVAKQPRVDYCYLCQLWFEDTDGTLLDWEQHLEQHYDELFASSATRPESTDAVFTPIARPTEAGLLYLGRFQIVKDQRPVLHGSEQHHITQRPWFCPVCVFNVDGDIPVHKRMFQHLTTFNIRRHIAAHYKHLDPDNDLLPCPVPACGQELHKPVQLMDHLVSVHALPVLGAVQQAVAHVPYTSSAPQAEFPFAVGGNQKEVNTPSVAGKKRGADDGEADSHMPRKRRRADNDNDDADNADAVPGTPIASGSKKRRRPKASCHRDAKRRRQQYANVPEFVCLKCHARRPVVLLRDHMQAKPDCSTRNRVSIRENGVDEKFSTEQFFETYPQWLHSQVDSMSDDEESDSDRAKADAIQWLRKHVYYPSVIPKGWLRRPTDPDHYTQARYDVHLWYRKEHPEATVAQFWQWMRSLEGSDRFWEECSRTAPAVSASDLPPP